MKKLLLVPLVAFGLGGCVTSQGGIIAPDLSAQPVPITELSKTQQVIQRVCNVQTSLGGLYQLAQTFVKPGDQIKVSTVVNLTEAVCGALTSQQVTAVAKQFKAAVAAYR